MKNNDEVLIEIAKYDLDTDLSRKFPRVWRRLSSNPGLSSQKQPIGILLGGQPGAGKSFATKEMKKRLNNNVLIINGDEFRSYHKHYNDFYQLYGKEASRYTREFAGRMVEKVRDEAIKQGFNIIIEGTFRTVDTPLKELNNFKEKGYKTEVIVCTCPKELSWKSTINRAEEQESSGLQPRYVPKEHHDLVISNLAKNTSAVFNSGLVSSLEIYSREAKLFDSLTGNAHDVENIINQELNRLSLNQAQFDFRNLFSSKLHERLKSNSSESMSGRVLSQTHKLTKNKKIKL